MSHLPSLIQALYKTALKPVLFQLDPETAHNWAVKNLKRIGQKPSLLRQMEQSLVIKDKRLNVTLGSLTFPNPVGLAAGFDKGADLLSVWSSLGFGFVEVGTFTPRPQEGKEKPRLFRYKKNRALVNRMGFNNPGSGALKDRFQGVSRAIPIGINIGKGRDTPNDKALEDYKTAFDHAHSLADYIVVNVSSPNTPGLRDLQALDFLKTLLKTLTQKSEKRIFTKVSPDLEDDEISEIAQLSLDLGCGLIATNTTINHSALPPNHRQAGGLSGAPIKNRANQVLKNIRQITQGKVPLIGVGGIFSSEDAYEKIRLGADLIQIYTGWIYEGPGLVPKINQGLLKLMERDGFAKLQDAVGTQK